MKDKKQEEVLKNLGGSIVSNNVLEKNGRLKWCVREEPMNNVDNGWRFFSEIDNEEYLSDFNNMSVCAWETVAKIEPAIIPIFSMPIGTELTLEYDENKKHFVNTITGDIIIFEKSKE